MKTVRNIFLYLDRTFVVNSQRHRSLWDVGLQLFRQSFIERQTLLKEALAATISLVTRDREDSASNSQEQIAALSSMFSTLQLYDSDFERCFLDATGEFYRSDSKARLANGTVREYLRHVSERLNWEGQRANVYLITSTRSRLTLVLEKELIAKHAEVILEKGFDDLMESRDIEGLSLLYKLFNSIQALDAVRNRFGDYIKRTGTAIVNDPNKDGKMIEDVLAFKDKLHAILENSFANCPDFQQKLKDSFEDFLAIRKDKSAELLAKYVDTLLSSKSNSGIGQSGRVREEFNSRLDQVMMLFRIISIHDVFESFYRTFLAKRLLASGPAGLPNESLMCSKLEAECGSAFAHKIKGMIQDIKLSNALEVDFQRHSLGKIREPVSVYVLAQANWPTFPKLSLRLPPLVDQVQTIFTDFYGTLHESRRLTWENTLSRCHLSADFPLGRSKLGVSLTQAAVLLLFTSPNVVLTHDAVRRGTDLDATEVSNTLHSLVSGKHSPLVKRSSGNDISASTEFSINPNFKGPDGAIIKIRAVQAPEVDKASEVREEVNSNRLQYIDAALVRLMKAKRTLDQTSLIAEAKRELRFPVEITDVNNRIESLIGRELLSRDPSNSQLLSYCI